MTEQLSELFKVQFAEKVFEIWFCFQWLDSQEVMQSLVSLFNPKIEKERHYNAAQLLCDFIRIARDTQRNSTERADPDPLLNTLES